MTVHITSAIRFFCLLTGLGIFVTGVTQDLGGAWYAIGFVAIVYVFTSKRNTELQPLIIPVSIAICFYYMLRLWDYYVFDVSDADSFQPVGTMILSGVGGVAMRFVMFATLAMYAGLYLSSLRWGGRKEEPFVSYVPQVDRKTFSLFLLGTVATHILMNFTYGDFLGGASFFAKFVALAVSHEAILPLAAIVLLRSNMWGDKARFYLILLLTIGARLAEGSRSGPLDVAEIMLAWAMIPGNWNGKFKLSASKVMLYLILMIVAVGGFVLATYIRQMYFYKIDAKAVSNSMQTWDDFLQIVTLTYHQISYRIGTNMDALLWMCSDFFDHTYANAHVNFHTMVQTTLRRMVQVPMDLGVTFEEFEFANLLGNRGNWVNGELVPTGYSWGVFGFFYQVFGFAASMPILFATCFGFGRLFNSLKVRRPSWPRDYGMYWSAHALELLIPMFSISNLLARVKNSILPFLLMILVIAWFEARKLRAARKPGVTLVAPSEV